MQLIMRTSINNGFISCRLEEKFTPNVQVEHNAGISIRIGRITKVFALVGFIDLVDEQCAIS